MKPPRKLSQNDRLSLLGLAFLGLFFAPNLAALGGSCGSEWVLVVNGASEDSRTIANHFAHWRAIPARNVIVLYDVPGLERTSIEDFRNRILIPVLKTIDDRKLSGHIQGIAYSSGFPTSIELSPAYTSPSQRSRFLASIGSLTGLTYLYQSTLPKFSSIEALQTNSFCCQSGELFLSKAIDASIEEPWNAAVAQLRSGDEEGARGAVQRLLDESVGNFGLPYLAAQIWNGAGEEEAALDFLEQAIERGWSYRTYLTEDPKLESLKETSRFQFLRDLTPDQDIGSQPTRGFDARKAYTRAGFATSDRKKGDSFLLCTSLTLGPPQEYSLASALQQLNTSTHADWTKPEGQFYFGPMDFQEEAQLRECALATKRLKQLGYAVQESTEDFPVDLSRCLGLFSGSNGGSNGGSSSGTTQGVESPKGSSKIRDASQQLKSNDSAVLPGAIIEHQLVRSGASMSNPDRDNLLQCFKRGAAGSSGAVCDSRGYTPKPTHPMVQAHYASGATLAEAYYLSTPWPWQLLVVGDPLCQPFATPPRVEIEGLDSRQQIDDEIRLRLKDPQKSLEQQPARLRLLIDGQRHQEFDYAEEVTVSVLRDNAISPGAHLLSMVVIDDSLVQNKWEWNQWFQVLSPYPEVKLELLSDEPELAQGKIRLRGVGPEGCKLRLMHHSETLVAHDSHEGTFELGSSRTGRGPIELVLVAVIDEQSISSFPVQVSMPLPNPSPTPPPSRSKNRSRSAPTSNQN